MGPRGKIDAGSAHITGISGDFGFFDGFMLSSILRLNDSQTKAKFTLLGGGLGYVGGAVYSHYREMTWGDSEVLRMTGLLGILAAAVPLAWAEHNMDERIPFSILTVNSVVGLVVGDRLTVDRDIDVASALIVDLATIAGGLVGLGTVFLVQGNQNTKAGPLVTGAALGAGLSFFLSYRLSDKPHGPQCRATIAQLAARSAANELGSPDSARRYPRSVLRRGILRGAQLG